MVVETECILGNPRGGPNEMVVVKGNSFLVKAKEAACSNASSLALKLMDVFFTREELSSGCCTEAKGKALLDPEVIDGIRSEFLVLFEC